MSASAMLAAMPALAQTTAPITQTVCFYHFDPLALEILTQPNGLPTGADVNYLFIDRGRTLAAAVRSHGRAFQFAHAIDLHDLPGWVSASAADLKNWARDQRIRAADAGAAGFALNDVPRRAAAQGEMRGRIVDLVDELHGDGALRGACFLEAPPNEFAADEPFWNALDRTCDFVIAEQYLSFEEVMAPTIETLADRLFALPRALARTDFAAARRVAQSKFVVQHSSYYGAGAAWKGIDHDQHAADELQGYFLKLIQATRHDPLGRARIGFAPLAAQGLDAQALTSLRDRLVETL